MSGLWDRPGVPHKGWRCVGCTDLEEPVGQCEMCGHESIRYVHHMEHSDYPDILGCGCVCAEKMEDNYAWPRMREQRMKNKAGRRARWLGRKWRVSAKGNPFLNAEGLNIVVFRHQMGSSIGKRGYSVGGIPSRQSFATEDEAKLAAFEEFWARISSR